MADDAAAGEGGLPDSVKKANGGQGWLLATEDGKANGAEQVCVKSLAETAAASRAYTVALALERLYEAVLPDPLVIHIVGADFRELPDATSGAAAAASASATFEKLAERLKIRLGWAGRLRLLLVGPGVDARADDGAVHSAISGSVQGAAEFAFQTGAYDEARAVQGLWGKAHAAFCFDAGVWGYDSWPPTIVTIAGAGTPVVITAYNWYEADDDQGALEEVLPPEAWVWGPQANPFASLEPRASHVEPKDQWENSHWQCVRLSS
eukprot:TRINITY_DN79984_c0_g1_i1.p1 TRINITY_DN79984_c0_g1~~TRINITY_DN79984_c0_g1_i1.p1  ORF type:complete len:265 (+),score=51.07 TRINITY_DN79984_c0_g1_i1:85-879(+)